MHGNALPPQAEMPEKGLNKTFFTSELPKVLLVIVIALVVKSVFFPGSDDAPPTDAWLAAPVNAPNEATFRQNLETALANVPPGFVKGMEERFLFAGYAHLRAMGGDAPRTRDGIRAAAFDAAWSMAQKDAPFTLMRIVAREDALRKENPGWHTEFTTLSP